LVATAAAGVAGAVVATAGVEGAVVATAGGNFPIRSVRGTF